MTSWLFEGRVIDMQIQIFFFKHELNKSFQLCVGQSVHTAHTLSSIAACVRSRIYESKKKHMEKSIKESKVSFLSLIYLIWNSLFLCTLSICVPTKEQ